MKPSQTRGRPPLDDMTAVTRRGKAVEFLSALPLEVGPGGGDGNNGAHSLRSTQAALQH